MPARRLNGPVHPVTVTLDGRELVAEEGEPLAASLVAAGALSLARSPKFHRPRGPSCFRSACDRVGLNLLVIIALNVTGSFSTSTTFFICTIWLLIASGLTLLFPTILINPAQEKV